MPKDMLAGHFDNMLADSFGHKKKQQGFGEKCMVIMRFGVRM